MSDVRASRQELATEFTIGDRGVATDRELSGQKLPTRGLEGDGAARVQDAQRGSLRAEVFEVTVVQLRHREDALVNGHGCARRDGAEVADRLRDLLPRRRRRQEQYVHGIRRERVDRVAGVQVGAVDEVGVVRDHRDVGMDHGVPPAEHVHP
jgi:hypothetical protein